MFFDEIQECPEAITALRYFYEEMPELHVISAGSLLDFTLNRVSVPVGRVSFMVVRPMSFAEFLIATNREKWNLERPHCLSQPAEHTIPKAMHLSLRDALRDYMIVGGMPSCVAEYKTSKNFVNVREIQADIVQTYLADVRKYTRGDSQIHNVGEVMANAFSFVGKQINYTVLGHGDAIKRTKQSVLLLEQAHVIHIVRAVSSASQLPLSTHASDKNFKILFLDIGLGQYLAGVSVANLLLDKDLVASYEGKLSEQFVGQELLATSQDGFEGRQLYYWARAERGATAEVDYLIMHKGVPCPLEVKSGPSGRLKSLHLYLKTYGGKGICLQDSQECRNLGDLSFWPIYSKFQ